MEYLNNNLKRVFTVLIRNQFRMKKWDIKFISDVYRRVKNGSLTYLTIKQFNQVERVIKYLKLNHLLGSFKVEKVACYDIYPCKESEEESEVEFRSNLNKTKRLLKINTHNNDSSKLCMRVNKGSKEG
jgi:hypothetical protein